MKNATDGNDVSKLPKGFDFRAYTKILTEKLAKFTRVSDDIIFSIIEESKVNILDLTLIYYEWDRFHEEIGKSYNKLIQKLSDFDKNSIIGLSDEILFQFTGEMLLLYASTTAIAEAYIENYKDYKVDLTAEERWDILEKFAIRHGGVGVASYGKLLFPEINDPSLRRETAKSPNASRVSTEHYASIPLPEVAPMIWKSDKEKGESPVQFLRRAYQPWLGHGLGRSHLRKLDPSFSQALDNWLRKNKLPEDIDLPTIRQQNDRWVERVRSTGTSAALGPDASAKDYHRLRSAIQRRKNDEPDR
ncbi:hypothetical protein WG908_15970 [Sphingobium sp. AN641]|uniref:hypothetical protein n=1 Tax=Sphingobium sp. AN641 TaxID=3133443 RepID=UPI0030C55E50